MDTIAIHGNGQTKEIWNSFSDIEGFTAIDLPGHGEGPRLDNYTLDSHAEYIASKITKPVKLIGHSLGGHIVLRVAKLKPDFVKKITTIGMAPLESSADMAKMFMPEPRVTALFEENPSKDTINGFSECMQPLGNERDKIKEMFNQQDPNHRVKLTASIMSHVDNEKDIVESLDCEVEILLGDLDNLINKDYVNESGLRVVIIQNSGHNIMLDQSDSLRKYI